ncbi:hypothetical protein Pmani_023479 [Petrolisthes manimaculis]|uniref:Uncharacterized protein n=1 Tax=Petrolisthes manimaculis TaxID=1843537 RepID=A0AAE1PBW9_9EUCA|nr:hypothetical protein Pmani_023479 [Petrolisthes manimaculis]
MTTIRKSEIGYMASACLKPTTPLPSPRKTEVTGSDDRAIKHMHHIQLLYTASLFLILRANEPLGLG